VINAQAVYIGVSQVDYSGYPDCRKAFLDAFQQAADLASKQFVEEGRSIPVIAPLLHLSKAETIRLGLSLGVDYGLTWSCYAGGETLCGVCASCRLRAAAFDAVGVTDPLLVR
jgi:7-cyano-7-deazaguanine synthase